MSDAGVSGSRVASVCTYRAGRFDESIDWLADEVPVALVFNGISHAVMLASPMDLEDFALGFALCEGLLENPRELYGIDILHRDNGIELRLEVSSACAYRLKDRRRSMAGRTGCGLCGTESLSQVLRPMPTPAGRLRISPGAVERSLVTLRDAQALQHLTGSSHAAAWCDAQGELTIVREDVGRHNALDKLVGALTRSRSNAAEGFIAVTSRASVEMVQKSLIAGVDVLVAVSAPTSLAVDQAKRCGLGLAGFAREQRFVCYAFPERFGSTAAVDVSKRPASAS